MRNISFIFSVFLYESMNNLICNVALTSLMSDVMIKKKNLAFSILFKYSFGHRYSYGFKAHMKITIAQFWVCSTYRLCFCTSLHVCQPKASNKMSLLFLESQDSQVIRKTFWGWSMIYIIFSKRKTCYVLGFFKTNWTLSMLIVKSTLYQLRPILS